MDNSFSGVALDDISLLPGSCNGDDISCNFESGICSWSTPRSIHHSQGELRGDLTWRPHSRLVAPVGPFWDYSSSDGGGYYLYVNYTTDKTKENRALLVSRPITPGPRCLRFWYFMTGMDKDCGLLRVKVHLADNSLTDAVWSRHADVRSAWKDAVITLPHTDAPYQLLVEGIVSEGSRGELAVDKLELVPGPCVDTGGGSACEQGQFLCHTGLCINASLQCDSVPNCPDRSDEDWRAGCPSPSPQTDGPIISTCPSTHYRCHDDGKCIPSNWVCDSFRDCTDESDEGVLAGCKVDHTPSPSPTGCRGNDQFLCGTGVCIPATRHCDDSTDCPDGSDEHNCNVTIAPPVSCVAQFACRRSGKCLPLSAVCDGQNNCDDASDEDSEQCAKAVPGSAFGTGGLIGVCVSVAVLLILIVLVVLWRRRRKKPTVRRPPTTESEIATISRYSGDTALERQISMLHLQARREPMHHIPPSYFERQRDNRAYTPERLPPDDEAPPPYDAVIKAPRTVAALQPRAKVSPSGPVAQATSSPHTAPLSPGRTFPRIRLGTTPLHPRPLPRNYLNDNNRPVLPLNYMNYDTDGDSSSVDHIYETLNLPDSRPHSPHTSSPTGAQITTTAPATAAVPSAPVAPSPQRSLMPLTRPQQPPVPSIAVPTVPITYPLTFTAGQSYPQLCRNNAMLRARGSSFRHPYTTRSRTPDSQCHLLPASNNSSFDTSNNGVDHPRQDSATSVVFSNLEDTLLPTDV